MTKESFKRVFEGKLSIDPEVCRMLGVSQEQLAAMDLGTFAALVFAKGYDVSVSGFDAKDKPGALSITTDKTLLASQS